MKQNNSYVHIYRAYLCVYHVYVYEQLISNNPFQSFGMALEKSALKTHVEPCYIGSSMYLI